MPETLDIYLQRNEDWSRLLELRDSSDAPLDLSGCSLSMQVKSRTNNATVIDSASISITDAVNGKVLVTLFASSGYPLSFYGSPLQTVNLRYDLVLVTSGGLHVPLLTGAVVLSRGVTLP